MKFHVFLIYSPQSLCTTTQMKAKVFHLFDKQSICPNFWWCSLTKKWTLHFLSLLDPILWQVDNLRRSHNLQYGFFEPHVFLHTLKSSLVRICTHPKTYPINHSPDWDLQPVPSQERLCKVLGFWNMEEPVNQISFVRFLWKYTWVSPTVSFYQPLYLALVTVQSKFVQPNFFHSLSQKHSMNSLLWELFWSYHFWVLQELFIFW